MPQNRIDETILRERFREFVRTSDFTPYFNRLYPAPRLRWLFGLFFTLTCSLVPLGLTLLFQAWRRTAERRKVRADLQEFAGRARFIRTYPVMVNRCLLERPGTIGGGLVFGTFDPRLAGDRERLSRIEDAFLVPEEFDAEGVEEQLSSFRNDETYQRHRRRPLPAEVTGGAQAFAFDLQIPSDYLPPGWSGGPILCLADPGAEGSIYVVPWRLIEDMTGKPE